eukprot:3751939-Ditylum_brightwellii.AAC.1
MNKVTHMIGGSKEAVALMKKVLCTECLASNSNLLEIIELKEDSVVQFEDVFNNQTSTQTSNKSHKFSQVKIHQDKRLECIKQYLEALPTDTLRDQVHSTALETLSAAII